MRVVGGRGGADHVVELPRDAAGLSVRPRSRRFATRHALALLRSQSASAGSSGSRMEILFGQLERVLVVLVEPEPNTKDAPPADS